MYDELREIREEITFSIFPIVLGFLITSIVNTFEDNQLEPVDSLVLGVVFTILSRFLKNPLALVEVEQADPVNEELLFEAELREMINRRNSLSREEPVPEHQVLEILPMAQNTEEHPIPNAIPDPSDLNLSSLNPPVLNPPAQNTSAVNSIPASLSSVQNRTGLSYLNARIGFFESNHSPLNIDSLNRDSLSGNFLNTAPCTSNLPTNNTP